jgi:galactokinase
MDVMGGSAEFAGGLVCVQTMDRGAVVILARRGDRELCLFDFDRDGERAQQFAGAMDAVAGGNDAHGVWACLRVLHEARLIDLGDERMGGMDVATISTVPKGAGLGRSAGMTVATMMILRNDFGLVEAIDSTRLVDLCRDAEGGKSGAGLWTMLGGNAGQLMTVLSQRDEVQGSMSMPRGIRAVGIDTGIRPDDGDVQFSRTRCAAMMGQKMILAKMEEMGRAVGRRLVGDPLRGCLANLNLDDYKKYFRSFLPESMEGGRFIEEFGSLSEEIEPAVAYFVQSATDHHVHEPSRVKNFVGFMEQAGGLGVQSAQRSVTLDKAGHLMYASHISTTRDARLGAPEADLLVDLVRKNERAGLYGARMTGRGQGGTVAVLANDHEKATEAINAIVSEYEHQTGRMAEVFWNSGPGALEFGARTISFDD